MSAINVWYIRRNGEVKGPFPSGLVTRHILLGRVRDDDEISPDGRTWSRVSDHPELVPSVVKENPGDPVSQERLVTARRWADERNGERRGDNAAPGAEKRRRTDRRTPETPEEVGHRLLRSVRTQDEQKESHQKAILLGIVAALAVGLGAVAYFYTPAVDSAGAECSRPPAPKINWSNCSLEGAKLAGANLAGAKLYSTKLTSANLRGGQLTGADLSYAFLSMADLDNADLRQANLMGANLRRANLANAQLADANLAYADLTGAELSGANLRNVKLGHAIWPDGTICSPASLGRCEPVSGN
ncbi:MAG: pentapeptide repeat-containing protein [Pseudomonadota bacterium]